MANVFWDAHRVIYIGYLEKGRMINGAYHAALLDRLVDETRKKRPQSKKKKSARFAGTFSSRAAPFAREFERA